MLGLKLNYVSKRGSSDSLTQYWDPEHSWTTNKSTPNNVKQLIDFNSCLNNGIKVRAWVYNHAPQRTMACQNFNYIYSEIDVRLEYKLTYFIGSYNKSVLVSENKHSS